MDLSSVQVDIAQILGLAITIAVGALAQRGWVYLNRLVGHRTAETLTTIAPVAVSAAEELGRQLDKADSSASGPEKLDYASHKLQELAKVGHIKLSDEQAKALIEGTLNQVRPYMQPPDVTEAQLPQKSPDG